MMNIEELITDLRARINPQYYDQVGTESYERHQCVLALESLLARNEVLVEMIADMRKEIDRLRGWIRAETGWRPIETAPMDGTAILVMTGESMHVVRWINIHGDFDYWAVDDNKHGPFTLRGKAPIYWMPLPDPAL